MRNFLSNAFLGLIIPFALVMVIPLMLVKGYHLADAVLIDIIRRGNQ